MTNFTNYIVMVAIGLNAHVIFCKVCLNFLQKTINHRMTEKFMPPLNLIYCQRLRRSETERTATYHVRTQRQHLFLLLILLLSQQLLPTICQVSGEFIFQRDRAPAHRARQFLTLIFHKVM